MPLIPYTDYNDSIAGYWELEVSKNAVSIDSSIKIILGYEQDEVIETLRDWKKLIIPTDLIRLRQKFEEHLYSKAKKPFVLEVGFYHRAGHIIYFLFTGRIVDWGPTRHPLRISGTYLEITAQKKAEGELKKVKDLLQRTSEVALIGGWELDLITNKVTWTDVTKLIFEVPQDFVPAWGVSSSFIKEDADRQMLLNAVNKSLAKGEIYDLEFKIITAKGNERWTRVVGHPEFINDKCVRLYGVFQDIDQHKKNEEVLELKHKQVQQAAIAKLEFLSIMSHEIRTPMNAVIGFTNLLLQNPRKDQLEYLNVLKFSAENLLILINDILDFNKIDAGKIDIEKVNFDFFLLIKNIYASQQQEADKKDLELALSVGKKVPQFIIGDPVRLGQVITNLVANAIKFTHKGKVEVIVTLLEEEEQKVKLHFEVKDTGIGIPKDKIAYIFERFTQASSETTRKYGGTGLGLTICKRLLELVDSQLFVQSELNKGSLFFFDLSFKRGMPIVGKQIKTFDANSQGFPGKRVLITEDNPINVMVVKKFLQQWKVDCEIAENGRIAFEKAQGKDYDMILMDLQMPVMDGYDATIAIRNLPGQQYKSLPIIALTASAVEDLKERITESGMNDCITKPFKPADLYNVLLDYF